MADYKGRTRTPYTNAQEASKKAQEAVLPVEPCADITEQPESLQTATEQPKKRGRPAKAKE